MPVLALKYVSTSTGMSEELAENNDFTPHIFKTKSCQTQLLLIQRGKL
jgi:hypothetical protein